MYIVHSTLKTTLHYIKVTTEPTRLGKRAKIA